jgi:hypothetical protein
MDGSVCNKAHQMMIDDKKDVKQYNEINSSGKSTALATGSTHISFTQCPKIDTNDFTCPSK